MHALTFVGTFANPASELYLFAFLSTSSDGNFPPLSIETTMQKEEFLHLQHSESVVAQMSATIFASLVARNDLNAENENALLEKSVQLAIKLASLSEKYVKSDEEWVKKNAAGNAFLGG